MNNLKTAFLGGLALALLVLAGCAPIAPAPTTTSEPMPPVEPAPSPPQPSGPAEAPGAIRPDRGEEEPSAAVESAIAGLIAQGWRLHSANNYEGALGIAERAQRIEPRNPEVYLLMASAQFGLYRLDVAEQLARRGLSLSRSGTLVNGQLQGLLGRIQGAR
ncbi:MAG: hypothetical protein WC247_10585 [Porticoccaceae bacterium]